MSWKRRIWSRREKEMVVEDKELEEEEEKNRE